MRVAGGNAAAPAGMDAAPAWVPGLRTASRSPRAREATVSEAACVAAQSTFDPSGPPVGSAPPDGPVAQGPTLMPSIGNSTSELSLTRRKGGNGCCSKRKRCTTKRSGARHTEVVFHAPTCLHRWQVQPSSDDAPAKASRHFASVSGRTALPSRSANVAPNGRVSPPAPPSFLPSEAASAASSPSRTRSNASARRTDVCRWTGTQAHAAASADAGATCSAGRACWATGSKEPGCAEADPDAAPACGSSPTSPDTLFASRSASPRRKSGDVGDSGNGTGGDGWACVTAPTAAPRLASAARLRNGCPCKGLNQRLAPASQRCAAAPG